MKLKREEKQGRISRSSSRESLNQSAHGESNGIIKRLTKSLARSRNSSRDNLRLGNELEDERRTGFELSEPSGVVTAPASPSSATSSIAAANVASSSFYIGGEEVSPEMITAQLSLDSDRGPADLESNDPVYDELAMDLAVETPINFEGDDAMDAFVGQEFLSAMVLSKGSRLAGKTVSKSGIDKLPGVHLFSIERPNTDAVVAEASDDDDDQVGFANGMTRQQLEDRNKTTISQEEPLKEGDVLWWSGSGAAIGELRKIPGLQPLEGDQIAKVGRSADRRLVQAVIARKGPLVGKSIKEAKFRTRFNCVVIAVHREGTRVKENPGSVVLQAGDVLLLEAASTFVTDNKDNTRCFALVSELEDSTPPRLKLLIPALILTIAMLVVFTIGVASLLETALCASVGMILIGILTQQEARDAINWEIYVTIAGAFGIGKAMINSGVANGVAQGLSSAGDKIGIGQAGVFSMIYLATFLISNVVTNNAAAALIFPIAIDVATKSNIDPIQMSYCVMLSASASFMSPFGYQTNLMVYGPGGYKYVDFLKFGFPMQVVLWIFTVAILSFDPTFMNTFYTWVASFCFLAVVFVARWRYELRHIER